MGESSSENHKIDVPAPRLVAFIGAIAMIFEGFLYLQYGILYSAGPIVCIITGISGMVGGLILLLVLQVGIKINTPIPYTWWLLLVIGGGVLLLEIITQIVMYHNIFGIFWYLGALLVGIASLLELNIQEKLKWSASKFVMLIGAAMVIVLSVRGLSISASTISASLKNIVVVLGLAIGLASAIILLLMLFKLLPFNWWLVVIMDCAAIYLVHFEGAAVILVGLILLLTDS
jgi:hypothetical protein